MPPLISMRGECLLRSAGGKMTFRSTLAAGHALAEAAEAALATSQAFDCVAALHELLTDGVVIGCTL